MFDGVIPPLTTPFSEEGRVLYPALEKNLEAYADSRLSGVLALGSNGEAVHLTPSEQIEVVRLARSCLPPDRVFLIGVSAPTLDQAKHFIDSMSDMQATAFLVGAPSYYKNRMSCKALRLYFESVAEHAPAPVLLYNVPQYSGIELQPELIAELAQHDRISGMKDSSGNLIYLERVLEQVQGRSFQVVLGSAQLLGPATSLGIRAAILAVACALPELPIRVLRAEGLASLRREQLADLFRIAQAVTVGFGIPGLKFAMDLAGLRGGLVVSRFFPWRRKRKRPFEESLVLWWLLGKSCDRRS